MIIWFDMDGTITDLYGYNDWLSYLMREQTKPYREAKPLVDMRKLGKELKRIKQAGHSIGIITWYSKHATENYQRKIEKAKQNWLKHHLSAIEFDLMFCVPYGTPKDHYRLTPDDILFDDEPQNRAQWRGRAHPPEHILDVLKAI